MNTKSKGKVDLDQLCPYESGMQILRLPEIEFMKRILNDPSNEWSEKAAKAFYLSLWKLLIDARTSERRNKLKLKNSTRKECGWRIHGSTDGGWWEESSSDKIHNDKIHIKICDKKSATKP